AARTPTRAYRQGLLSNLSNPKMGIFFTSLLPQFATSFAGVLALGAAFAGMTLVWLALYAIVIARVGDRILGPRVRRALDAVAGGRGGGRGGAGRGVRGVRRQAGERRRVQMARSRRAAREGQRGGVVLEAGETQKEPVLARPFPGLEEPPRGPADLAFDHAG